MPETCPRCGTRHDQDLPACPYCGLPRLPTATCQGCGTRVRKDDGFCWSCGGPLEHQLYCWHCGEAVWTQSAYCSACGAPQPDLAALLNQVTRQERTSLPFPERRDPKRPEEERLVRQNRPAEPVPPAPVCAEAASDRPTVRIEPVSAPKGDRLKIVTVLFADVSGFTKMSENLHPEDVKDIMDECFAGLTEEITSRSGTIDKYIGDCVMALFGAETAREDDPERAIDAALAMQDFLRGFSRSLKERLGLTLAMRVGINTGTVLAGYVGTGDSQDFTVMGDAVNLASRLEHACPVGSILVSHDTHRMVQGLFEVRTLEPIQVKGKSEPVRVVEVLSRRSGGIMIEAPRFQGQSTKMIGREREMNQLRSAFLLVRESRRAVPATIRSDIGMGKSRLIYEFVAWLTGQDEYDLDFMRCRDYRTETTFAPLVDLVYRLVDASVDDSEERLEQKVRVFLNALALEKEDRERVEAALMNLLGIPAYKIPSLKLFADDPEQIESAVREGVLSLYRARAARRLVVLAVEDLHAASDPFLDLLVTLSSLESLPLLVVMSHRPDADTRVEDRFGLHEGRVRCSLESLTTVEASAMIRDRLKRLEEIPEELVQRVLKVSEGRPLFVEEILSDLAERQIIRSELDPWEIDVDRALEMNLPQSVEAAILSRVDALPEDCKDALRLSSVVGDVCWDILLRDFGVPEHHSVLDFLEDKQFIRYLRQPQLPDTREFVFVLPAVREALERHVLRKVKTRWHGNIAEWIDAKVDGEHEYFDRLLGHHYFEAGNIAQALPYRLRSGQKAEERGDVTRALMDLQWVWKHARDKDDKFRVDTIELAESRVSVARLYRRSGKPDAAEAEFSSTRDAFSSENASNPKIAVTLHNVALETARSLIQAGERTKASVILDEVLGGLGREHDREIQIAAWAKKWQGWIHQQENRCNSALGLYQEGIELVESLGNTPELASLIAGKGMCLSRLERFNEAETELRKALQIYQTVGHRDGESGTQGNLGVLRFRQGEFDDALQHFREAMKLREAMGDQVVSAILQSNIGDVLVGQGHLESAKTELEGALVTFRRTRSRDYRFSTLQSLILCMQKMPEGDSRSGYEEAVKELRQVAEESGEKKLLQTALAYASRFAVDSNDGTSLSSFLKKWIEISEADKSATEELEGILGKLNEDLLVNVPEQLREVLG